MVQLADFISLEIYLWKTTRYSLKAISLQILLFVNSLLFLIEIDGKNCIII